jgi:hypothetical protein
MFVILLIAGGVGQHFPSWGNRTNLAASNGSIPTFLRILLSNGENMQQRRVLRK